MRDASTIRRVVRAAATVVLIAGIPNAWGQARVIELTADKDSRYKIPGLATPEITVHAN